MKKEIRTILREGIEKNVLGIVVSRPTQELIVMRGIPGSGKSTKAKELAGQGKIHSTDDVIEAGGNYNEFFAKMIVLKDFTPLSRVHSTNLKNAISSMKSGVTPVIIDNTNIKQNEAKAYVVAALELGYSDNNIKFVDIGTAGLEAVELAKRNTHGVPLDKIEMMIASHTAQGPLTLKSVLGSKDMYKQSDVLYSAVVLDNGSRAALLSRVGEYIPEDWKVFAHHMTIVFGKGVPNKEDLGKEVTLYVEAIGLSDMAMAVRVEGYPSANAIPHITIAINPDGGKPVMSNDITKWQKIKNFAIKGVVTEIKKGS
jgi:predicted kinase